MKKVLSITLAIVLLLALSIGAFAADTGATGPSTVAKATIDTTAKGSLSIYKYDMTQAAKDGAWDVSAYVSTGEKDSVVEAALGTGVKQANDKDVQDLGNSENSNGYAVKGVEFSYLKVAEIVTYTKAESGVDKVQVLYKIASDDDLLEILDLTAADDAYTVESGYGLFTSDTLIDALKAVYTKTATKTALEEYMEDNSATVMDETDEDGHTSVTELPLGLYLIIETEVPEMVMNTVAPFFVSVPMTAVEGGISDSRNADGGNRWIYDITLYPKNETDIPSLEKTVREAKKDTGANDGTTAIDDGFAHTATASDGDVVEYQIISTLPTITSEATYLTKYDYVDVLAKGIEYNKDLQIDWFSDAACTTSVATWTAKDSTPKFTATYTTTTGGLNSVTITMTGKGLEEINDPNFERKDADVVGYSGYTMRISYSATLDSNAEVIYGDTGNDNDVALTWSRSGTDYYDTLVDDCHVYTYGLDLIKTFSSTGGDFSKVEFLVHNDTDNYYVTGTKTSDIWYVTDGGAAKDHATAETAATHFTPDSNGKLLLKGLEDDTYTITEVRTANGYTLLKEAIVVRISNTETKDDCAVYDEDELGVIQNDLRWLFKGNELSHKLLTASATVDNNTVAMESDSSSANALVPLSVVNTRGFVLPQTGSEGNMLFPIIGISAMVVAAAVILIVLKSKKSSKSAA